MKITNELKLMLSLKKLLLLMGGLVVVALVVSTCVQKSENGIKRTIPIVQPEKELKLNFSRGFINSFNKKREQLFSSEDTSMHKEKIPNFTVKKYVYEINKYYNVVPLLIIKNTGNVKLTNITFIIMADDTVVRPNFIIINHPEDVEEYIRTGKIRDKQPPVTNIIPELDVNKSAYLLPVEEPLILLNETELKGDRAFIGWLIVKCDQGIEKKFLCIWGFRKTVTEYRTEDILFSYLWLFLFYVLPLALLVVIICLINKIRRKKDES